MKRTTAVVAAVSLLLIAMLAMCARWAGGSHKLAKPAHIAGPSGPAGRCPGPPGKTSFSPLLRASVEYYLADLPRGSSVLDLGCGYGALLASLRDRGWKLTGADIDDSRIRYAREQWPGIRFEVADGTADLSSLGYGEYDAVISTEVIEHIYLPRLFARNCFRLLRPGGRWILSTPYHGYFKNLALALSGRFDRHLDPLWDQGHVKFWSLATLSALQWETGFTEVEYTGAGRLPYLWGSVVMKATRPQ